MKRLLWLSQVYGSFPFPGEDYNLIRMLKEKETKMGSTMSTFFFFFFKPHFDFKTRPVILSPKALGKKNLYWGSLPGVAKT